MYIMEAGSSVSIPGTERAKVFGMGALGGLVATLVIVGLILLIEAAIAFPRGLFYTVIGNALGATGTDATMLGFSLHLVTGTLIGVVASAPLAGINKLYVFMDHILKRFLYGVIIGSLVWVLFFLPISYTQVATLLEDLEGGYLNASGKMIRAEDVSNKFTSIVVAALAFHIQYGLIYAVITGTFISRRIKVLASV
jgi:hypothetical protein